MIYWNSEQFPILDSNRLFFSSLWQFSPSLYLESSFWLFWLSNWIIISNGIGIKYFLLSISTLLLQPFVQVFWFIKEHFTASWKFKVCIVCLVLFGLFILQPILIANKLENFFDNSWYVTLIPLWILDGFIQIGFFGIGIHYLTKNFFLLRNRVTNSSLSFLIWSPFVAFQILLVAKAEGDIALRSNWAICFLPLWFTFSFSFLWTFMVDWRKCWT